MVKINYRRIKKALPDLSDQQRAEIALELTDVHPVVTVKELNAAVLLGMQLWAAESRESSNLISEINSTINRLEAIIIYADGEKRSQGIAQTVPHLTMLMQVAEVVNRKMLHNYESIAFDAQPALELIDQITQYQAGVICIDELKNYVTERNTKLRAFLHELRGSSLSKYDVAISKELARRAHILRAEGIQWRGITNRLYSELCDKCKAGTLSDVDKTILQRLEKSKDMEALVKSVCKRYK